MKKLTKIKLAAVFACACSAILGAAMMLGGQIRAGAEENMTALTSVPEDELVCLSNADAAMFYSNKTGATKVRYTAAEDYALTDVTDIAVRLTNSQRQTNKSNASAGLTYYRIKFKDNDTVYNIKNEQYILGEDGTTKLYTHFKTISPTGSVKRTFGITGAGQMSFTETFDGTVYIPLWMLYDGKSTEEADCLTSRSDYADLKIEYVEFEVSTYRWDLIVGDMALVKHTGEEYTETVMRFEREAQDSNCTLLTDIYDDVELVVNDVKATADGQGAFAAALGEMGSVQMPADKLMFFRPVSLSSKLGAGYGITNILINYYKDDVLIDAATRNPLSEEYALGGEYTVRDGGREENTSALGQSPVKVEIRATVSPLIKLNLAGESEGVEISYKKLDDGSDGVIYLAKNQDSTLTVKVKEGFDFAGLKLGNKELENVGAEGTYEYVVRIAEESSLTVLGLGEEVRLNVLLADGIKAEVAIGDRIFTAAATEYASNLLKKLTLSVLPDAGYAVKVEKVIPATETEEEQITEILSDTDEYVISVDGAFNIRVSTSVLTYRITYRLNNGVLAEGESNPETITVLDAVELKNPVREGYTFTGWKIEGRDGYVTELKNISEDITVVAEFKREVAPDSSSSADASSSVESSGENSSSVGTGCGSTIGAGMGITIVFLAAGAAILKKKKR